MTEFIEQQDSIFWKYLGSFWKDLSDADKSVVESYWSSLNGLAAKLYLDLYYSDLSKAILNVPPYFETTNEYFTVIFSGIGQNIDLIDSKYRFYIPGILNMPTLVQSASDPLLAETYDNITWYNNIHYTIATNSHIDFNENITIRNDSEFSDNTNIKISTFKAPIVSKINPVLFNLYGNKIKFNENYYINDNYSPTYTSSGLKLAKYYEYELPTSGLILHLRADYGVSTDEDGNLHWLDASWNVNSIASVSGLAPVHTTYADGTPIVQFDGSSQFLLMNSGLYLNSFTAVAVAKHTDASGRPYIVGGEGAVHLGFAGQGGATTFGVSYGTGHQIATTTSDEFAISVHKRTNDGVTGQRARLNGEDITTAIHAAQTQVVDFSFIGRRSHPSAVFQYFGGDLAELFLYSRDLSDFEIEKIEKSMSSKYPISLVYDNTTSSKEGKLDHYKFLIEALNSISASSPTVNNLKKGYQIARGIPFSYENGIASITSGIITIGNYQYLTPSGTTLLIEDGNIINKFDILVSGVHLYDIINNSGLVVNTWPGLGQSHNKYIIQEKTLSGIIIDYSQDYLNSYFGVINPAGLTYKFSVFE